MIGEDESSLLEVFVASEKDGVQHGLVEQEVAHPFGYDDVELLDWELDVLELALHESDGCGDMAQEALRTYTDNRLLDRYVLSLKPLASTIFSA